MKLKYKCLAFNGVVLQSNNITFKPDLNWKDNSYFTINGNLVTLNYNGSWTSIIGDQSIKQGIHHFTCKVSSLNKQIACGFFCQVQNNCQNPIYSFDSYNSIYFKDGTLRSKGTQHYLSIPIQSGEVIHTICDMNNHIITWINEKNSQVLGQAHILTKFKGNPMTPFIYLKDKNDQVQIL